MRERERRHGSFESEPEYIPKVLLLRGGETYYVSNRLQYIAHAHPKIIDLPGRRSEEIGGRESSCLWGLSGLPAPRLIMYCRDK